MTRYLVTGGAGFIGSSLTRAIVERGGNVRVFDSFLTGREENLADLPDVEVVRGDVRDLEGLRAAMKGVDRVLHQAAVPSVARSLKDPILSNEANVQGTLNVLLAARDAGVPRVVFASSSSVYGDTPTLPKVETMLPSPLSPYAVTKLTGEHYLKVFHHLYGLETVALRYFNVFGPRRAGDVMHSLADIEKARRMLGYEPSTSFEEGLERTVAWGRVQATV